MGEKNEISADERVVEIEVERLRAFNGHPFKVVEDDQMLMLMDSIKKYGILTPLIVRPVPEGFYEIISGHRRHYAAKKLGYRRVPVIIRVMKDPEAVISMVDSNMQREKILPSEKAFAIRMKYEAIRRKSGRKSGSQVDSPYYGKRSVQIMSEEWSDSPKQIQRYLKITELIPELLEKLDDGKIAFIPAFEAAFLSQDEQRSLLKAMEFSQGSPSISQMQRIRKLSKEGVATLEQMRSILGEVKKGDIHRVLFKNEQLYRFFPRSHTPDQMREEILVILEKWFDKEASGNECPAKGAAV